MADDHIRPTSNCVRNTIDEKQQVLLQKQQLFIPNKKQIV